MTFGFIFTRKLEAFSETCYRLTIPSDEYLSKVKSIGYLFKNHMDSTIEVSHNSFLDSPDALIHTIGPLGQFTTSEAEVL